MQCLLEIQKEQAHTCLAERLGVSVLQPGSVSNTCFQEQLKFLALISQASWCGTSGTNSLPGQPHDVEDQSGLSF